MGDREGELKWRVRENKCVGEVRERERERKKEGGGRVEISKSKG